MRRTTVNADGKEGARERNDEKDFFQLGLEAGCLSDRLRTLVCGSVDRKSSGRDHLFQYFSTTFEYRQSDEPG